jgi:hypothetical protein
MYAGGVYREKQLTMARIMAIDYGLKRTGLAVTDPFADHCNGP